MKTTLRACMNTIAAVALLAGCAGVPVNFASNSVTDRSLVDLKQGKKITASATGFQLMLFIPIAVNGRQRNAYESLLQQAGDSVLSDITITESWTYALVGTMYTTTIEATAYPRQKPVSK